MLLKDGKKLQIYAQHYVHDGLSAGMIMDYRQTRIKARILSPDALAETYDRIERIRSLGPRDFTLYNGVQGREWYEVEEETGS